MHPRTRAAVRAVRDAGIPFVIVTGRMFRSVKRYLDELELDGLVVCYQGAVVADASGRFLRHVTIPLELAREAIAAIAGRLPRQLLRGRRAVRRGGDEGGARATPTSSTCRFTPSATCSPGSTSRRRSSSSSASPKTMDALELELKGVFGDRLYISKSLPEFLELAATEVTKATGFALVAEQLGVPLDRVVGFGDGENDVELLESVGYAVAVANAHERVLAVADFVCPSAAEEGVAQVIEAALDSRG